MFIIEERMKDITFDTENDEKIVGKKVKLEKKSKLDYNSISRHLSFLTVRGLN